MVIWQHVITMMNFDLTVEFKQEADGNSGVFIRSFIEEDVKVNGWQVEVAPKGHDTGGIYESYGRGWLIQIPDEKETILKEGDWNTMRIKVQGDNVQTWLNGEEMVNINDEKNRCRSGPHRFTDPRRWWHQSIMA